MSGPGEQLSPHERMARLERRAEILRSRLVRAVDAIDQRRHQVVEVGKRAKAMAKPAIMTLVGIGAVIGIGAFAVGAAIRSRRQRSLKMRLSDGLAGTLAKVDRAREPALHRKMFERVAMTAATFLVSELAKRMTKNFADGRFPNGQLALGRGKRRPDVEVRTIAAVPSTVR